jgi:putative hydrolase of the HAD superfamily
VSIRAVVFDLDGVVRHFLPTAPLEARFGLPEGALYGVAFEPSLLDATVVGEREYAEWIELLGEELARRHGEHTRGAALAFSQLEARVDEEVIDLIRPLRDAAYRVAILTNGTTRVEAEVAALGLHQEVEHVFNSARIGAAKPDARAYRHVLATLDVEADEAVFTDDSPAKCDGARAVGMHVVHFTGAEQLDAELRALGLRYASSR